MVVTVLVAVLGSFGPVSIFGEEIFVITDHMGRNKKMSFKKGKNYSIMKD
jgi:hypothetical protein